MPIRVCAEQIGVRGDHLRLEPNAELQPLRLHAVDQRRKSAGELLLIDHPVAQRGGIVIAMAEPAVVHHQQLDPQRLSLMSEGYQLVAVKIKVRRLPAIDEQGALFRLIAAADQMPAIEPMENAAHFAKSAVGIHHHDLGGIKGLPRRKLPAEARRVDAHQETGGAVEIALTQGGEVAGIDQIEAVHLALLFIRVGRDQRRKRILTMAGHPAGAFHALYAMGQTAALHVALLHVAAIQGQQVIVHGGQVQAHAENAFQLQLLRAAVLRPHTPGHNPQLGEHRVVQRHLQPRHLIDGRQLQRRRVVLLLHVGGRLTGDRRLARIDFVPRIANIRHAVALLIAHHQRGNAHVSRPESAVFHGRGIRREAMLANDGVRRAERRVRRKLFPVGHIAVGDFCAIIQVEQIALVIDADHVG